MKTATPVAIAICGIFLIAVGSAASAPQISSKPTASVKKPVYSVNSVSELKKVQPKLKMNVSKSLQPQGKPIFAQEQIQLSVNPDVAAPLAYSTGKGVVLDIFNPSNTQTGSYLTVRDVEWNDDILKAVMAKDKNLSFKTNVVGMYGYFDTPVQAKFCKLPKGKHTYILTVGITGKTEKMKIYVNGPGDNVILGFDGAELAKNASPTEQRIMFTLDNAEPTDYLVRVLYFYGDNPNVGLSKTTEYFHHMQLVALD